MVLSGLIAAQFRLIVETANFFLTDFLERKRRPDRPLAMAPPETFGRSRPTSIRQRVLWFAAGVAGGAQKGRAVFFQPRLAYPVDGLLLRFTTNFSSIVTIRWRNKNKFNSDSIGALFRLAIWKNFRGIGIGE